MAAELTSAESESESWEHLSPSPNGRPFTRWAAALAVGGPLVIFALHASLYGWWVVDDAAITWAYARSIAEGAGPVLQPGVPAAEGWSNTSWLLIFILAARVGAPFVVLTKVLALLCAAGTFAALWSAARFVLSARRAAVAACVAGVTAALVPSWVAWSVSGLEAPLYALIVASLAALCVRARTGSLQVATAAGVLASIASLTRPDGIVYAAAYPLAVVVALRRDSVRSVAVSLVAWALPVGAYLTWRWVRFGTLLPNTAIAKAQGAPTWGPLSEFGLYGLILVPVAAVTIFSWVRSPRYRSELAALAVVAVLALSAYAVLEPDWMGQFRFAAPLWPVAALLGAVAAATTSRTVCIALIVAVAVLGVPSWVSSAMTFRDSPTVPACLVAQINGAEMNAYAAVGGIPTSGTLLVPDVGGAALVGRLRVVDLAGLAEPTIARFMASGNMAGLRAFVFERVRPTFVSVHGAWGQQTGVANDPRLRRDYELVAQRPDGQVWVRRDVVTSGTLEAMRTVRRDQAALEAQVRSAPRARCSLEPA
ncbi:hypothetical protein [Actinomycetospora sp. NBRC 106378]|uniref:hypothetical protein n=1 Tax=Actinomycetospora sp. NBRC 106378 TaxID=3032208 RepID=UPI0024A36D27|nr:hypothetical protein [Actinomycetospora sp. NBRC 106378]GLZ52729.1 hypothetical protein Acsp07_23460 [Actinomycetospora sp. NBRC 106378]